MYGKNTEKQPNNFEERTQIQYNIYLRAIHSMYRPFLSNHPCI